MIAHAETSVLKEIVYLDPELNGDAEYLRVRFPPITAWSSIRSLVCSPCFASLILFLAVLIIGVNQ